MSTDPESMEVEVDVEAKFEVEVGAKAAAAAAETKTETISPVGRKRKGPSAGAETRSLDEAEAKSGPPTVELVPADEWPLDGPSSTSRHQSQPGLVITHKAASLSVLLSRAIEADPDCSQIRLPHSREVLTHTVDYLNHHDGVAQPKIEFPLKSVDIKVFVRSEWDQKFLARGSSTDYFRLIVELATVPPRSSSISLSLSLLSSAPFRFSSVWLLFWARPAPESPCCCLGREPHGHPAAPEPYHGLPGESDTRSLLHTQLYPVP
jgi:hypothetical protein